MAVIGASRAARHDRRRALPQRDRGDFEALPTRSTAKGDSGRRRARLPLDRATSRGAVDLAVVCVPGAQVLDAADAALRARRQGACVISAGFAETGDEGPRGRSELLALVRAHGARMIGPNCLGIASTAPRLNATFARRAFPPGRVAFSSQSGALGLALLEQAEARGLGLSAFASIGNKADVSSNDLLEYWEDDPRRDVVLLYLESFGNPRKFAPHRRARRALEADPRDASGTSKAGARAAASHTARLPARTQSWTRCSAKRVCSALDAAGAARHGRASDRASLPCRQPRGDRDQRGRARNPLRRRLRGAEPRSARVDGRDARRPRRGHAAGGESRQPRRPARLGERRVVRASAPADARRPERRRSDRVVRSARRRGSARGRRAARARTREASPKPLLSVVMSADGSSRGGFEYPESAARALGLAAQRAAWLRRPSRHDARGRGRRRRADARSSTRRRRAGWSPLRRESCSSPTASRSSRSGRRKTPDEAAAAARELGLPVVVKTALAGAHKTESGGVVLDVRSADEVRDAAARIGGPVVVQRYLTEGTELLAGLVQDPVFGPLVAFGPGGVLAELIGSANFALAPLTDVDAARADRRRARPPSSSTAGAARPRPIARRWPTCCTGSRASPWSCRKCRSSTSIRCSLGRTAASQSTPGSGSPGRQRSAIAKDLVSLLRRWARADAALDPSPHADRDRPRDQLRAVARRSAAADRRSGGARHGSPVRGARCDRPDRHEPRAVHHARDRRRDAKRHRRPAARARRAGRADHRLAHPAPARPGRRSPLCRASRRVTRR